MKTQTIRRIISGLSLLMVGLAIMFLGDTQLVRALPSIQAAPTPVARTPRWRNQQSTTIPRGLHRTASISVAGGAWTPPNLCTNIETLSGNTAWTFTPSQQIVLDVNNMGIGTKLQGQQCGTSLDLNATATLRTPDGQTINLSFWNDPVAGLLPGYFLYELDLTSELGNYVMTIRSNEGLVSHSFTVVEGPFPWIRLANAQTGKMEKIFARGDAIQITYKGLYNTVGNTVEVGLYRNLDGALALTLIDWWTIPTTNGNQDYQELLSIPSSAPEDFYIVMACINECKPTFVGDTLYDIGFVYNAFSVRAGADSASVSCHDTIQGKIAWNYSGNTNWDESNIARLCTGNESSAEPALCFNRVMHEGINWGGGTQWRWENALNLCKGTTDADATIACFEGQIQQGRSWQNAIRACASG